MRFEPAVLTKDMSGCEGLKIKRPGVCVWGGGAAGSFGSSENKHRNAFQNKRAEDDKTTTAVDFFGKTCRSVGQQEQ